MTGKTALMLGVSLAALAAGAPARAECDTIAEVVIPGGLAYDGTDCVEVFAAEFPQDTGTPGVLPLFLHRSQMNATSSRRAYRFTNVAFPDGGAFRVWGGNGETGPAHILSLGDRDATPFVAVDIDLPADWNADLIVDAGARVAGTDFSYRINNLLPSQTPTPATNVNGSFRNSGQVEGAFAAWVNQWNGDFVNDGTMLYRMLGGSCGANCVAAAVMLKAEEITGDIVNNGDISLVDHLTGGFGVALNIGSGPGPWFVPATTIVNGDLINNGFMGSHGESGTAGWLLAFDQWNGKIGNGLGGVVKGGHDNLAIGMAGNRLTLGFRNQGEIAGRVYIDIAAIEGGFRNQGTLSAGSGSAPTTVHALDLRAQSLDLFENAAGASISAEEGDAVNLRVNAFGAPIRNAGTVEAQGDGANGFTIRSYDGGGIVGSSDGAFFVNLGDIVASQGTALWIRLASGGGESGETVSIENDGLLSGQTGISALEPGETAPGSSVFVVNRGRIESSGFAVLTGGGDDTFVSAAGSSAQGQIDLGSGHDAFRFEGGTLTGGIVTDENDTLSVLGGSWNFGDLTLSFFELVGGAVTGGTLTVQDGIEVTEGALGANLASASRLTKSGSATVTLTGDNSSLTGGIDILSGKLVLGSAHAGGTGTIRTFGTVIGYASGVNNAAPIELNSDHTQLEVLSGYVTQSGKISQDVYTRPLEKTGSGVLGLSGANTYDGLTTVSAGRLQILDGGQVAGDVHIGSGAWFDFGQSGALTFSHTISGDQLAQIGSGVTTLTAANTHAYTGISGGTLRLSGAGTLGAPNAFLGISGASGVATLDLNGTAQSLFLFTLFAGYDNAIVGGTLTVSNVMDAQEGLICANLNGSAYLSKTGAGTTILSGTNDYGGATIVSGGTLIAQGGFALPDATAVTVGAGATLQIAASERIGRLSGTGTVALGSNTLTFGDEDSAAFTGTFTGDAESGLVKTGSGLVTVAGLGHSGTTQIAAGELRLNGTAAGDVIVQSGGRLSGDAAIGGDLTLLGALNSGNSPGTTYVGGNFTGGGVLDVEIQFDNAGSPGNGVTHDFLDIAGSVLGAATAVNLLPFAPSGDPSATEGLGIQIVRVGGAADGGDFFMTSYLLGDYYYDLVYRQDYESTLDGFFLTSRLANPGCEVDDTDNACFVDASTDTETPIDALAGNDTLQLTGTEDFSFDMGSIGTLYTNFEVFQKAGVSTVTLTGTAASQTQGVDVQNGTLIAGTGQLGAQGAVNVFTPGVLRVASALEIGTLAGTGTVNLQAGLTVGGGGSSAFAGSIEGTGELAKVGAGALTLTGPNSYSGGTAIHSGSIVLLQSGALGSGPVIVGADGHLQFGDAVSANTLGIESAGLLTFANDSTAGSAVITSSGRVHFKDMATGGMASLLMTAGTLDISQHTGAGVHLGALFSANPAARVFLGGRRLVVGSAGSGMSFAGVLSDGGVNPQSGGGLTKTGTGSLTLSGANTYTGLTDVAGGQLLLQGGSALHDLGAVNIGSGAVLGLLASETIGSLSGSGNLALNAHTLTVGGNGLSTLFSGGIAGSGSLTKTGIGALTLSGAAVHTGHTSVEAGILNIGDFGTAGSLAGNVTIGAGAQISFRRTDAHGYAGNIAGQGKVKQLAGTLTLSGTNAYTGLTFIGAGATLIASGGSAIGDASQVVIEAGGELQINGMETIGSLVSAFGGGGNLVLSSGALSLGGDGQSTLYSGTIAGAGKLIKSGGGIVTLTGSNSFSGGIDILHGGIRLGGSSAAGTGPITTFGSVISYLSGANNAAPVVIASNTTQFEVLTGSATQSGAVGEAGGSRPFEKIGAGELVLSGPNTFSGATTISQGTLTLQGGQALSDTSFAAIAGTGTLSVAASETIGGLAGSGALDLGAGATLTFGGNNASSVYSGASSGSGNLTKAGTGTLLLTGANAFSGLFSVSGGSLIVTPAGSLANMSLSVGSGASAFMGASAAGVNGPGMTGAGMNALSVANGGTLYLDDHAKLAGASLSLAAGSNLSLFLTTNTTIRPQIKLSGTANIAGANLGVYLDPLSFAGTTGTQFVYDDVIMGSARSGTFGAVNLLQTPNNLFSVAAIYGADQVDLQVSRATFGSLAGPGGNQAGVGGAIEAIYVGGTSDPDLLNLIDTIANSSSSAILVLYSSLSGSVSAEAEAAALRTDDPWKQSVAERVNAARATGCTVAGDDWCFRRYAQAEPTVRSDVLGDPAAFDWLETGIRESQTASTWARAIGGWAQTEGGENAAGSEQVSGGLIGGVDYVFDSLFLAGVAGQYVETNVDFDAGANESAVKAVQLGAYMAYGGAQAYVNANASVIGAQTETRRFVSVGLLDYALNSFMRSWTYTAAAEFGAIYELDGLRFEPALMVNYQYGASDDYGERGGGGIGLLIDPDDTHSLRTSVSARISRVFDVGDRKIVPQVKIDWRHEYLDRGQNFTAAFAGAPGVTFGVRGLDYARDTLTVGGAVTVPLTGRVTGYADVQGSFNEDVTAAMATLGLRASW